MAAAIVALVACSSCSSKPKSVPVRLAAICTDVRHQIDAVPAVDPNSTFADTASKLDREYPVARDAEGRLRGIAPTAGHRYDDFLGRWHTLAARLGVAAQRFHGTGLRNTNPDAGPVDTVDLLTLAGASKDVGDAGTAVTKAANRAGLPACAQIPWRYLKV